MIRIRIKENNLKLSIEHRNVRINKHTYLIAYALGSGLTNYKIQHTYFTCRPHVDLFKCELIKSDPDSAKYVYTLLNYMSVMLSKSNEFRVELFSSFVIIYKVKTIHGAWGFSFDACEFRRISTIVVYWFVHRLNTQI